MKILLISTAFSGLTQRFYTELDYAGYIVSVELHHGNSDKLLEGVALFKPDLILCPFLTRKIPVEIYQNYKCLIVHPGIEGDRGPSSLDWAIQNDESEWGITLLEAQEEMDMGDIWAKRVFPMRNATKSSLFNREITQGAVDCLWEALTYFNAPDFKSRPLDYGNPEVKGRLMPMMKQKDRKVDWKTQKTDEILKNLYAADGSPGVLDELYGLPVYLYNASKENRLKGVAGKVIATANHAICRATVDGAIWIGHLKAKAGPGKKNMKLPATFVLKDLLPQSLFNIEIDYTQPERQLPCQEVWYELNNRIAYVHFPFHNGGMSTEQCCLLLEVYRHVATLDVDVIVLKGGEEFWSNGIHLNHIEAAANPAEESWLNINAIDDVVLQIINTQDKVTISAVAGNAGAGGAILALAADKVFVREGVIFNPHYKNMGQLYGSEYWTYLLPKRVGEKNALKLTEQRLPIGAKKAWSMGLIDKVLDKNHEIFAAQIEHLAMRFVRDKHSQQKLLETKSQTRCFDESQKALASYRQFELKQMYANFYGNEEYHKARRDFVYKIAGNNTPENIAVHRQENFPEIQPAFSDMIHFTWQEQYETGDHKIDGQHKDLFELAKRIGSLGSPVEPYKKHHFWCDPSTCIV